MYVRVIECIPCGVDIAVKMYEIDIRIHLEYVWHGTLHFSQILLSWFRLEQVSIHTHTARACTRFYISFSCVKIFAECAQC